MGGSSGGGGYSAPPQVQYSQPIDYGAMMQAASNAATAQIKQQYASLIENYPKLEELTFGTVKKLGDNLNTQERKDALAAIRRSMSLYKESDADPTSIEQSLYDSGESDLALGRSLSPEDVRSTQQAARAAFAARGLGTSAGSAASEILGRQAMADQREAERRNFAASANNLLVNNVGQRRTAIGNANIAGASNLIAGDPYAAAVGPALGYAGGTQQGQMQQIGNTFSSANQMAGNVASFNANMLDSRANASLNNWAALQAAGMQANAMNNAATMGMIGSIGGGLLSGAGMGLMMSDKREKTDIKPIGKAGSVLGLTAYEFRYKTGERKAKHVGFMAQDVAKVLPEAVEEVTYKGKRRLAIKPAVIGAALAREISTAKAA